MYKARHLILHPLASTLPDSLRLPMRFPLLPMYAIIVVYKLSQRKAEVKTSRKRKFVLEAYLLILIVLFYLMYKKDPTVSLVTMIDAGPPIGFLIAEGEVWRYFTGMFLHGSWTHVIDNCIGLYILGRKIEAYYGT